MRILLDTHILLWWLGNVELLPRQAAKLISDPANTIFISAVTLWEIWLKVGLVKLQLPADFERRLAAEGFENLPLRAAHTRSIAFLPWHHRDPFDRMLVAQAEVENLILLTADEAVAAYGDRVRFFR